MGPAHTFESVSRRPPDVEDYIDIVRRYRSWIIGPTYLPGGRLNTEPALG